MILGPVIIKKTMFTHQIQYHRTLNPKIWLPDNTMDPLVRRTIVAIAADFIDYMHAIGFQITRNDILDIVIYVQTPIIFMINTLIPKARWAKILCRGFMLNL